MTSDGRKRRGRAREGADFPVAPSAAELPPGDAEALDAIKAHIACRRLQVVLAANRALIGTYWEIGRMILERQKQAGWGAKVIDRLSRQPSPEADLRQTAHDSRRTEG